jgi:hypothetical protein
MERPRTLLIDGSTVEIRAAGREDGEAIYDLAAASCANGARGLEIPFPSLPQRPVAALLPVRAIRGRGTRRGGRVLAGLPLQLLHPRRKPLGLTSQLSDQPVRLRQPDCQLSSRKTRQLLRGRHTSHIRQ